MSDKPVAILTTTVVVVPVMVACCVFGPAAVAWVVAWASASVGGVPPVAAVGLATLVAILVYGFVRRRRANAAPCEDHAIQPAEASDDETDAATLVAATTSADFSYKPETER